MPKNDWNEYKNLFLNEIDENKKFRSMVTDILGIMREDISGLKVKTIWLGGIAGGIASIVGTGIMTMILAAFKKV